MIIFVKKKFFTDGKNKTIVRNHKNQEVKKREKFIIQEQMDLFIYMYKSRQAC